MPELVDRRRRLYRTGSEYVVYEGREALCEGPTRSGKALPLWAQVWTPTGPKAMGDIVVGDKVLTPEGTRTWVVGVYDQPAQTIYRLTLSTGETVHATGDHLWRCWRWFRPKRNKQKFTEAREVLWTTNEIRARLGTNRRFDVWLPRVRPVMFDQVKLPMPAYVMGVVLGDGCLRCGSVTFTKQPSDAEIVERVRSFWPDLTTHSDRCTHALHGANDIMRGLGLMGKLSIEKHIPDIYKRALPHERMELLRGMMDTDGTVSRANGIPSWSSSSRRLAEDFCEVLRSLGGAASISTKKTTHADSHRVNIRFDEVPDLFTLARKRDICRARSKFLVKRLIRAVEPVSVEPARCIKVADRQGMFLTDNFVPTHNTMALLLKVDLTARNYPGSQQLVARQTRKSLNESVLKTWRDEILWQGHPAISKTASREHQDSYRYPNGSEVVFVGLETMQDTASPILSTQWDRIIVVQSEEVKESAWETLSTRLSSFKTPYRQMTADCNPANPSHWLNKRFQQQTKIGRQRFRFRHYDNPLFYDGDWPNGEWTREGKEYTDTLESTLTGVRYKRFYLGQWAAADNLILENFDPTKHVVSFQTEKTEHGWMVHMPGVEQPIRIAYFTAGVDWGWHPDPGAMSLWGYDAPRWHPKIRRFRFDEVMKLRWTRDDWRNLAVEWAGKYDCRYFSCDRSSPESIAYFNIGLQKYKSTTGAIALKCPPIGGGHRMDRDKGAQIDLMRDGLGSKDGHQRTYLRMDGFSEGKDDELRRTGRPTCYEEEAESWTWKQKPGEDRPDPVPDDKCDEHALDAARADETLNFARGFGRDLGVPERRGREETYEDAWKAHMREKKRRAQ